MRIAMTSCARARTFSTAALLTLVAGCDDTADIGAGGSSGVTAPSTSNGPSSGPGGTGTGRSTGAVTSAVATTGSHAGATSGGGPGVDVVIAQGAVGRTMISCDGGLTFGADRSDDAGARCGDTMDCDHHPGSPTGLVIANGRAVLSTGWGTPGVARTSVDGATWQETVALDPPFASLAVGNGVVMGATPRPKTSADGGATWVDAADVYLAPPLRQSAYLADRNRFLLTSEGSLGLVAWWTDDAGASFQSSEILPSTCIPWTLVAGNGVAVMQRGGDGVCRSDDGGATWSEAAFGGAPAFMGLDFVAGRFVAVGADGLFESTDARTWTRTPVDIDLPWNLVVGHDDATGVMLAAAGAYEDQRFYRSVDGASWQIVDGVPGGHPIRRFVSGRLDAAACP